MGRIRFIRGGYKVHDVIFEIEQNINNKFHLRDYQREAIFKLNEAINNGEHFAFQMATGSGKTLVMACNMLQLAQLGYSNFIFLVNSENIITKTRINFLETYSEKYLFNRHGINLDGKKYVVREVENFEFDEGLDFKKSGNPTGQSHVKYINIAFMTIQKLHSLISNRHENCLDLESLIEGKIAILSDEAHHINSSTKKSRVVGSRESFEEKTWEDTVLKILNLRRDNTLLEYTATMGLHNGYLAEKYQDKLIFNYDFHRFRRDGYSKEVKVIQSNFNKKNRILSSLIISEYKKYIAEDSGVSLKPVILIKSKNIKTCGEDVEFFNNLVKDLNIKELMNLESIVADDRMDNCGNEVEYFDNKNNSVIYKALKYFKDKFGNYSKLVELLRYEFCSDVIEIVHSKIDKNSRGEVLERVNDLENNNIRVIFSVDMLNEGWDVLNLFDIVRLDESDGKKKDVVKDVQLIGRGARYYPFESCGNKYKRKFDYDFENPLKSIEELHYYSYYNPKYLSELREVSEKLGIIKSEDEADCEVVDNVKGIKDIEKPKRDNKSPKDLLEMLKGFSFRYIVGDSFCNEEIIFDFDSSRDLEKNIKAKYKYSYECKLDKLDSAEFSYPIFRHCFNYDNALNLSILKRSFGVNSFNEFLDAINSNCKIKICSIKDLKELDMDKVPMFKSDVVKFFYEKLSKYLSRYFVDYSY